MCSKIEYAQFNIKMVGSPLYIYIFIHSLSPHIYLYFHDIPYSRTGVHRGYPPLCGWQSIGKNPSPMLCQLRGVVLFAPVLARPLPRIDEEDCPGVVKPLVDDVFWGFNHHLCGYKTIKTDVVNPKINYPQLLEVYDGIVFFAGYDWYV